MPAVRLLPSAERLRKEYAEHSAAWVSTAYGVHYDTVRSTMRRDARRLGLSWPMKPAAGSPGFSRAVRKGRDEVRALLVVGEINEALQTYNLGQHDFSRLSGVPQSQLSRLLAGQQTWVRRKTAARVENAIVRLERRRSITSPEEETR